MREIPLPSGQAHIRFTAKLGDERVQVRLDWLTRFGYFLVRISQGGETIISGRGLHPEMGQLEPTRLRKQGELYLTGKAPTLDNLGTDNKLFFVEAD